MLVSAGGIKMKIVQNKRPDHDLRYSLYTRFVK